MKDRLKKTLMDIEKQRTGPQIQVPKKATGGSIHDHGHNEEEEEVQIEKMLGIPWYNGKRLSSCTYTTGFLSPMRQSGT